jgi:hypothetical protein
MFSNLLSVGHDAALLCIETGIQGVLHIYNIHITINHLSIYLSIYTAGRTHWTGDQTIARPLPAHTTTSTQNKHTQTSMPSAGFEPTIPAFERAKRVHALDCSAILIGNHLSMSHNTHFLILSKIIYLCFCEVC